ncbi:MAG TPA: permease-like cell division protein FtsX [Steroidobacteraceae bacterium]|nr:permease-like cell division protein FtsX [Steroidobacteraceae bacterium]
MISRHGHALLSSVGHLGRHALPTLLTIAVMGLALSLPLSLEVLVRNVRQATSDFSESIGLSIYFKNDVAAQKVQQLEKTAKDRSGVASVTLVTPDQALDEFRTQSGFGTALDALSENPLPALLIVHPLAANSSPEQLDALRDYFSSWPEVDTVQLDRDWVLRFTAIVEMLRRTVTIAAILLGAGVVAVVGNTIRLEILNRRAEIEVTKLVGGTNAFVRRPFLYAGILYGVGAGVLAWGIVAAARLALSGTVTRLAAAYGSQFLLAGPNAREFGLLLVSGIVLGWVGAWIAAARQLARIEPRA